MRTSAVKEKKDEAGDRATQALRKQLLFQKSPWLQSVGVSHFLQAQDKGQRPALGLGLGLGMGVGMRRRAGVVSTADTEPGTWKR
jgi:hypothetical protein